MILILWCKAVKDSDPRSDHQDWTTINKLSNVSNISDVRRSDYPMDGCIYFIMIFVSSVFFFNKQSVPNVFL